MKSLGLVMDKPYSVWRMLPEGDTVLVGMLVLTVSDSRKIINVRFQYTREYIRQGLAPLDPVNVPVQTRMIQFETNGQLPGFIDDCIPDAWGQKVIAASCKLSFMGKSDILDALPKAVVGDTIITTLNVEPKFDLGLSLSNLKTLKADDFNDNLDRLNVDYDGLKTLLQGGSGVGGARPKLLVSEASGSYIYKFNRSQDSIDVAANEWASLEVMRQADINLDVCEAKIDYLLGRKFLKVKRFDVSEEGRYRLITLNGLLKTPLQEDNPFPSYDGIANIIKRHSISVEKDLKQLISQALFNQALNNTDDHLRNFSFINKGKGYQLSPAYDVLPSDTVGAYHQLTLCQGFIPTLEQADKLIKQGQMGCFFDLDKTSCKKIVGSIRESMQDFQRFVDLHLGSTEGAFLPHE